MFPFPKGPLTVPRGAIAALALGCGFAKADADSATDTGYAWIGDPTIPRNESSYTAPGTWSGSTSTSADPTEHTARPPVETGAPHHTGHTGSPGHTGHTGLPDDSGHSSPDDSGDSGGSTHPSWTGDTGTL